MNQNEYWNSVAEEKKFTTVLDVELFSKYVSKDCKILDVGCGYGRILNELAEAGFTDLTGVDSAENMIKRGLREYPNLNLFANPDGAIPFEDNSFDAVILFGVLTCVPDNESQKELLNNIKKVLKPGGRLVIITYHSLEDRMVKNMMKTGNIEGKTEQDFFGNVQTPFRLVNNKVIVASNEEVTRNPRSRSAKLRIAEKK